MTDIKQNLGTKEEITWCPGCPNFMILESVKQALANLISKGMKQEEFAMTTDIGWLDIKTVLGDVIHHVVELPDVTHDVPCGQVGDNEDRNWNNNHHNDQDSNR